MRLLDDIKFRLCLLQAGLQQRSITALPRHCPQVTMAMQGLHLGRASDASPTAMTVVSVLPCFSESIGCLDLKWPDLAKKNTGCSFI